MDSKTQPHSSDLTPTLRVDPVAADEALTDAEITSIYTAWDNRSGSTHAQLIVDCYTLGRHRALASRSPAQAPEPLTDEHIERIYHRYGGNMINCARAIERAALAHRATPEDREQFEACRRALEVIAVGDSTDPVRDAGDELVALGFWNKEALDAHRATAQAPEQPVPSDRAAVVDPVAAFFLRRALRQLNAWQEKYGAWNPQWLPPAGGVRLAEDVDDYLTRAERPKTAVVERALDGRCAANQEGDCTHSQCPQHRDGEPAKSGRSCPIWTTHEEF